MSDAPLLRIQRIEVDKLFGLYDHRIDLNLDERVTIIHGPNGVGKTVLLKLTAALFAGRLSAFTKVPLERFEVHLTDGTAIRLERCQLSAEIHAPSGTAELQLTLVPAGALTSPEPHRLSSGVPARKAESETPNLAATLALWGGLTGAALQQALGGGGPTLEDIAAQLADTTKGVQLPSWFDEIRSRVSIHVIETQRLLRIDQGDGATSKRGKPRMKATVQSYADELRNTIRDELARSANVSQSLDQTFPQRLLQAEPKALSADDLTQRMTELDSQQRKLASLGLIDTMAGSPLDSAALEDLDATRRSVMTLYVEDTAKKLAGLVGLANRIELLRRHVNAKLRHKSLSFNRDFGFAAVWEDGRPVELDSLSSGEQHELVMLYDLLFRVEPNTLVLIDEPELSLHVVWQKRFLPDLMEIVRAARFDALVATHSPFIVGDRSDLLVALGTDDE